MGGNFLDVTRGMPPITFISVVPFESCDGETTILTYEKIITELDAKTNQKEKKIFNLLEIVCYQSKWKSYRQSLEYLIVALDHYD